jgi:hypothetical protein
MQLLQSVLTSLKQTKKPPDKFVTHLLGLMLMLPGPATLRHMSRSSPSHARTFARWDGRGFDWVALHQAAITAGVPPEPAPALGMAASVVPKSGPHPSGRDRFWNGSHRRADKGLDISPLAWRDLTGNGASCLRVEPTPPSAAPAEPEATRLDVSLDQRRRGVQAHAWRFRRDVVTAGADRQQPCVAGVRALERHQMGKWRTAAHGRALSQGPKRPGPGRPKTSAGKVNGSA